MVREKNKGKEQRRGRGRGKRISEQKGSRS
jgi:hypothetical protein